MKRYLFVILILFASVLFISCKKEVIEENFEYSETKNDDLTIYNNVKYGDYNRNVLDIYIPSTLNDKGTCYFCIHGGGYTGGYKELYKDECIDKALKYGMVCVSINYRYLTKEVSLYDIIQDVDNAVTKTSEFLNDLNIKINYTIMTGGSAGAHLSLLYGYKYQESSKLPIKCILAFAPPVDYISDSFLFDNEFKPKKKDAFEFVSRLGGVKVTRFNYKKEKVRKVLDEVSPINYVKDNNPKTIIVEGALDKCAHYNDVMRMDELIKKTNTDYKLFVLPNSGHGTSLDDIGLYNKALDYINEYLVSIHKIN